jgi:hypothetical protein
MQPAFLPAWSLLGQPALTGLLRATALPSHTVPGGMAGRGPCGERVAVLARGLGRSWGGVGGGGGGGGGGGAVVLDSAGSALSSRPEPPLAWA